MHVNVRIERKWTFDEVRRAALALAREVERRAPELATSKWWKEERHGVFLDYNQNAKDRTVAAAYSVRPTPDARVSAPLTWDETESAEPGDFTLASMPSRYARTGDLHAAIDQHPCSLDRLLELSAQHEREGVGDAPWPPHYRKQPDEPARVQPSRRRQPSAPSGNCPGTAQGRRARRPRAMAGASPGRCCASASLRRAGRCDARTFSDLDAHSSESRTCAGRIAAGTGAARSGRRTERVGAGRSRSRRHRTSPEAPNTFASS